MRRRGRRGGNGVNYDPNAVIITENITSPTTWVSGTVYVVDGYISVTSTFVIPTGTIIKFAPASGMATSGSGVINASAGTALLPIIFTSVKDDAYGGDTNMDSTASSSAKKDWYDITIAANGSSFNYCYFYYGGGYWDYTLAIEGVSGTVTNCKFAHNDGATYGTLDLESALAGTTITGNRFYDNVVPLKINTTFNVDDSNYFSDGGTVPVYNTRNGIFVPLESNTLSGAISWDETEVAYVIESNLVIPTGNSLTLGNYVVLKFVDTSSYLEYDGSNLNNYDGTGVAYTSYKDDARKGDTNGDGTATSPGLYDWYGVYNNNIYEPYYETWENIFYDSYALNP